MQVEKITNIDVSDSVAVERAFAGLTPQPIGCNNWAKDYPYAPEVCFRMFHTGKLLFLRFDVRESCTMALVDRDNGQVWTDSCVEFFIALDNGDVSCATDSSDKGKDKQSGCLQEPDTAHTSEVTGGYYNFETNCIGRLLLGFRKERLKPEYPAEDVMKSVGRVSTLGYETFAETKGDNRWSLTLRIPPQALFRHNLTDWSGVEARMNLYKCGDNLSMPHYLSWKPIRSAEPNFHLPEFFENVKFN